MPEICRHLRYVSPCQENVRKEEYPTKVDLSTNAFHTSHEPLFQLLLDGARLSVGIVFVAWRQDARGSGTRKKVHKIHDSVFVNVSGLQDSRGRQVLLLCSTRGNIGRSDAEISPLVLVKQTAENRRRVEVWPVKFVNLYRARNI